MYNRYLKSYLTVTFLETQPWDRSMTTMVGTQSWDIWYPALGLWTQHWNLTLGTNLALCLGNQPLYTTLGPKFGTKP